MQLKCKRIVDIAELNPSLILSLSSQINGGKTSFNVATLELQRLLTCDAHGLMSFLIAILLGTPSLLKEEAVQRASSVTPIKYHLNEKPSIT
jgi:hypothetical protein